MPENLKFQHKNVKNVRNSNVQDNRDKRCAEYIDAQWDVH